MRTTIILDDDIYRRVVQRSIRQYGGVKNISRTIGDLLKRGFQQEEVPDSMFGAWKSRGPTDVSDLRDEGDDH